jgi:predicted phosphodiesterase
VPNAEVPTDLIVVGDWGSGTLPEGAVAGAIQRYADENDVAAILTTGDNFYSDDWEFLMEPYGWAADYGVPFWITWGNHDVESETRIEAVEEAFDNPPRWAVYEWGSIDVIVLDSNQITSPQQALFFLDAMSDSHGPTIVAMHHPPYSCAHHGSTTEVVNQVVELLDDDVFLVLSGHEHVYQRFEHNRVAYVVTGGGGAATYELSDCPANHPEPLDGESTHHFPALEQTGTAIEVTAIDVNGGPVDEFEVPLP